MTTLHTASSLPLPAHMWVLTSVIAKKCILFPDRSVNLQFFPPWPWVLAVSFTSTVSLLCCFTLLYLLMAWLVASMFKEVILRKNMFKIISKVGVHHSNACRLGNWVYVASFCNLIFSHQAPGPRSKTPQWKSPLPPTRKPSSRLMSWPPITATMGTITMATGHHPLCHNVAEAPGTTPTSTSPRPLPICWTWRSMS